MSAIYVENDGSGQLYYAYTDYLGSLTARTDAGGNVVERQAFDPWGNRRVPNDWTSLITTPVSHITGRGYTMHEHLDGFALINMNGRVYDPQIARFLSPDPQLQAPGYWLNYNRYGYCLNNPLIYTDPSGEKWKWPKWEGRHWIPIWGQFDYLIGMINDNTTEIRQDMVDLGVPDFNVGVDSSGETFHSVGNGERVYHNRKTTDYEGVVETAISDARGREAYVRGESSLGDAGSLSGGRSWYSIYNWPVLGSSARSMDALYAGDYVSASSNFLTCAAEVFTFGYASTASVGKRVTTGAAKSTIRNIKIPVYRVYGGASKINGWSWSPINPKFLPKSMYRKYAGLPDVNWGTGYIKGSAKIKDMTLFRKALPLDGNPGGFPELIINPNRVNMWKYMNRPGNYNSYWGF